MISKDYFCEMMRKGEKEFSRLCRITQVIEEVFAKSNGQLINADAIFNPLNMMCDVLCTALSAPEGLVRYVLGLEDPDDTDMTELDEELPDGTKVLIHTYDELYDYLVERRTQLETSNQ